MLFQNGRLKVRELEAEDSSVLVKWLSNPAVLEFYEGRDNPFDLDKVISVFYASGDEEVRCIVEYDDQAIGYIQFYTLDDKTKEKYGYGAGCENESIYGIDQFIGEDEYRDKGIGTLLVTSMTRFIIDDKKADRVVMDPQTRNTKALKCYEKCGFTRVKLLPKRELHEGEFRDCWLIEYRK
ncbi:GNAT family N-acetyltransferase [Paenibacillus tuaregi]|uniref:GNAT family N-acetyltransferase n=1 Tax=Paenibacillus tuaregi TaxID=1816681 RepID=UPI0008380907|nr:GNAT family N-acetyltransferase [Paenibacillus tuaregi]